MPWRLKSDMRHFRALTTEKPVVMGRKTYLSLSIKPLPRRTNIVVTRDPAFTAPGVLVASSLEAALQAARGDALRRGADAIMVIGGGEIYAQAMPFAHRLEITQIHASPQGDARFPDDRPGGLARKRARSPRRGAGRRCGLRFRDLSEESRPNPGQLTLLRDAAPQQRACVESHGRVPYNPGRDSAWNQTDSPGRRDFHAME